MHLKLDNKLKPQINEAASVWASFRHLVKVEDVLVHLHRIAKNTCRIARILLPHGSQPWALRSLHYL